MTNRQRKIENKAMPEILQAMRNMGGQVTRDDVLQYMRENSIAFSEQEIDEAHRINGNTYYPFKTKFYFAVRNLVDAGFIEKVDRCQIALSQKGRNFDLSHFDPIRDVRVISDSDGVRKNYGKEELDSSDKFNSSDKELTDDPEDSWRQQLLDALMKMNPKKFEFFCRGLLKKMGIEVDETLGVPYVDDGGIDGFGYVRSDDFRTTRVALQAKRWQKNVTSPEIDKFRGAMDKFNAEFGIFITNSDFSRGAVKTARQGTRIITLINGEQICDLVAKYNYYVEPVTTYKLKSFYFDED